MQVRAAEKRGGRLEAPEGFGTRANKIVIVSEGASATYTNSKSLAFQVINKGMNEMVRRQIFGRAAIDERVVWDGIDYYIDQRTSISSPSPKFVSREGLFPLNSRA